MEKTMERFRKALEEEVKRGEKRKLEWFSLIDYEDETFDAFMTLPSYAQYAICEGNAELEAFLRTHLGEDEYTAAVSLHKMKQQLFEHYKKEMAEEENERLNEFQIKCKDATDTLNKKRRELKQATKAYAELVMKNMDADALDDGGEAKLYNELVQVRQQYDAIRGVYWDAWFDLIYCTNKVQTSSKPYIEEADSDMKPMLQNIVKVCEEILSNN